MNVVSIREVEGEQPLTGIVRKVLVYSDDMMLVYYEGSPGASLSHSHPHEQMGYIIKGSVELTAGGKTVVLKAGSSYAFKPNEYHEFTVIGDEPFIILDIFHPPREDYLPPE